MRNPRGGLRRPEPRAFLAGCLTALDASLSRRGGRLVVRSGPVHQEAGAVATECGATGDHVAEAVTGQAAGGRNGCAATQNRSALHSTCTTP
ncbi:deoxyribodipyrimidine photo-lyase [Streptomyces sp. NPDC058794]|uniref:deoxyribodipyrimidine photo-lyase n=1 Tax=Streptomyces sp. NPDC058794 TaxID=3346636 RepID=UPI0036C17184